MPVLLKNWFYIVIISNVTVILQVLYQTLKTLAISRGNIFYCICIILGKLKRTNGEANFEGNSDDIGQDVVKIEQI